MASYPSRQTASFDAIKPVSSLVLLDNEFDAQSGAAGYLKGGTTGVKFLFKSSDAADPPLEIDQTGAGPLAEWKQNGVLKASIENDGDLLANGITGAAGVYTFSGIPVGPNANPSTGNQLTRKTYVDGKQTRWTANWFISDPSTFPLGTFSQAQKVLISGAGLTAFAVGYIYNTGSASGSFTIEVRKHPFADQTTQTLLGTITVNPGAVGVGVSVDIIDHLFTDADYLYLILTARSSPLQRDVSIFVAGTQTLS